MLKIAISPGLIHDFTVYDFNSKECDVCYGESKIQICQAFSLTKLTRFLLGWSHTPDFIRGDKFVLHPSNTDTFKKKCYKVYW